MRNFSSLVLLGLFVLCVGCAAPRAAGPRSPGTVLEERYETIAIPPGHLPPPGECRIWLPGVPPGHQPPPGPCSELELEAPPGAWLIYGPTAQTEHFIVSEFDEQIPNLVISVRYYDPETGQLLRENQIRRKR